MRLLAAIMIQPHLKKGSNITPEKLLPLPWDKESKKKTKKNTEKPMTKDQQRKRMEYLVKKFGDELI